MKVMIFGGTTEGREMADHMADLGYEVCVSVASELGAQQLAAIPDIRVEVGRKNAEEMAAMLWTGDYRYCIDATHPYAIEATKAIATACQRVSIPYDRLLREETAEALPEDTVQVDSAAEACAYLSAHLGPDERVFLTTGAKEAGDFATLPMEQCYIRVLPTEESLQLCRAAGIKQTHILTGYGPFSMEDNVEALQQMKANYLVTKDGGTAGGFQAKLAAAKACGVQVILIRRPKESGKTMEQLLRKYERLMERMA